MYFDDNFELSSASSLRTNKPKDEGEDNTSSSNRFDVARILDLVLKSLGHRPPMNHAKDHYPTQPYE